MGQQSHWKTVDADGWATVSLAKGRVRIELKQEDLDELMSALYARKRSREEIVQAIEEDAESREIWGDDPRPYNDALQKVSALYEALLSVRYK